MSKKLTSRDFLKIKSLTAKKYTAAEISTEVGFSEKTVKQARSVSSYFDYKQRYCQPHKRKERKIIMTPVKTERPTHKIEKEPKMDEPIMCLEPLVLPKVGTDWKKVAIAFIAIPTTILLAFVAIETIIIMYFWSNYVS